MRGAYLLTAAMAGNTQQAAAIVAGDEKLGAEIEMDWALCSLQIEAYFRLGLTPVIIAARGRQSAGEPQSSPHP